MNHKKLDLEETVEKDNLMSAERRELFKKTGKMIYTAPILALLSTSADALGPPDPPSSESDAVNLNFANNSFLPE